MDKQQRIKERWILINRLFYTLVVFVFIMLLYREYKAFRDSVDYFNETSYNAMIHEVEHEVDNRVEEIGVVKEELDAIYQKEIKQLIVDLDFFAQEVVSSMDDSATLEEKREAYIDVVYNYDLRNEEYLFFAMDLNGLSYLSGTTKTLEGTDISGLVDQVTGRLFVQDMIDTIVTSPDGEGYVTYYWMKESGGEHFKKTSFVYYNEEVDLFIGTGIYEVDYIKSVQEELFERIGSYYNTTGDYIYIFGYDGTIYSYPIDSFSTDDLNNIQTTSGTSFHEYIVSNLEEDESVQVEYIFDFVEEGQLKMAYARRINEWSMYIGRSFVVDELVIEQTSYFQSLVVDYIVFNIILIIILLSIIITIKKLINTNFADVQLLFETQSKKIKDISYRDQLTKLYNRRYFDEIIKNTYQDSELVTAIMVDANGLKLINDAYGHVLGDQVLIQLSTILCDVFQEGTHFRWGGDEFVVIIHNMSKQFVEEKINAFHKHCKETKVKDFTLSASLGYAQEKLEKIDLYLLIDQAESMMYENKMYESLSTKRQIIDNILNTLYNSFSFEESHSKNVKDYALLMGQELGLSKEEMNKLRLASLMHDVGKIGVPDDILNKEEPLSKSEYEEIRKHPEKGLRILSAYPELSEYGNYALTHHEKYDGSGYPRGLKEEDIPLFSRIISIADAFDAMTSDRVYKKKITDQEALQELRKHKGTQFDPTLVDVFIKAYRKK